MIKRMVIVSIFLLAGIGGLTLSLYQQCSESAEFVPIVHYPASFTKKLAGNPEAGKLVYQEFCSACHADKPVIRVHAPAIGNRKLWRALEQVGKDKLLKITLHGKGAMPARGGCFECSNEQVDAAVDYILNLDTPHPRSARPLPQGERWLRSSPRLIGGTSPLAGEVARSVGEG